MRRSRTRFFDAILELRDPHGWNGISMRRLAQELHVWPMAVFRYFQDKDALLDARAEAAADRVSVPSGRGSWRTRISKLLREARGALGGQPASRARLAPAGARLSDAGMRILCDAGFDEADAA